MINYLNYKDNLFRSEHYVSCSVDRIAIHYQWLPYFALPTVDNPPTPAEAHVCQTQQRLFVSKHSISIPDVWIINGSPDQTLTLSLLA